MLFLLACTSAPSSPAERALDSGEISPVPRPSPAWEAAAAQSELDRFFSWGLPDPITIRDRFLSLLVGSDGKCPEGNGASITSVAGCSASTGWSYTGTSAYSEPDGGFILASDIYIIDPSGRTFEGGGQVSYVVKRNGVGGGLDGTWGYEDEAGWFGQNPSFNLSYYILPAEGTLRLDGGIGIAGQWLQFRDFGLDQSCSVGALALRDPSGWWYDISLGDSCDGVATLSWGDEEVGTVQISSAPLNDFARRILP